jgi:lysyl-tRNA synthetase class 2
MVQDRWRPSATIENLRKRAQVLQAIRDFFHARNIMEVETPVMCHTSVTDPFIQSIPALFQSHPSGSEQRHYLQTSPEYAMKRLLAAGSGAIFQMTKSFRQGEVGRFHNPEFTMLEWYRPGFDHHALMNEMDELLQLILCTPAAERKSYADLFQSFLHIDPHQASLKELSECAQAHDIRIQGDITDGDTWLNLLMTHCIEPKLGNDRPVFVYDFPASQAALARIQPGNPSVASRFEVYFRGIELANGFHELKDVQEQRKRFEKNLQERARLELTPILIDELFLSAIAYGLPDCAGIALGIDRLVMLATNSNSIADVLSFNFDRA